MADRWTRDAVLAVAPDASSVSAASDGALWGLCKGSGKVPYAIAVDLTGPAYKCSCPSRKFPCKHALGLLLRWADGQVAEGGEPPADVAEWLGKRAEKAAGGAEASAGPTAGGSGGAVADPEAQRKRTEERAARVASGLDDCARFLADQLRGGLAPLLADPSPLSAMARRMVDAQAPGVARRLEAAAQIRYADAPARLLEEFGLLHLLIEAYRLVAADPDADPELTATVRRHVGFPVSEASVREAPGVQDDWLVGDRRDEPDGHLIRRTTWLHGERTGRAALLLAFAPPGQPLDGTLVPGTVVPATLHFHPGAFAQRSVLGDAGPSQPATDAPRGTISDALEHVAQALAADPWLGRAAVWIDAVHTQRDRSATLVDELGDGLRVRFAQMDDLEALAIGGGRRIPQLVEWSPTGWRHLATATWAQAHEPVAVEAAPW